MYRSKEVEEALLHVVGWEQEMDPKLRVAGRLTESESGLTYQSAHPLCSIGMVNALMPAELEWNILAWNAEDKIYAGELRKHGGHYWKAKQASQGEEPPSAEYDGDLVTDYGDEYWLLTTLLTERTEQLTRRGIRNAVQRWMTTKTVNKESRTLLESRPAFDGAGRFNNVVEDQDKIVGIEINGVRGMGVTVKIDKIGLQFDGPGVVTILLFHSSQTAPVYSHSCTYDRENGSFKWFDLPEWYLPYLGPTGVGGSWYMVYAQRDLDPSEGVMEAIKVDKDWSREPSCASCNAGSIRAWRELNQYVELSPFQAATPVWWDCEDPQIWDIGTNVYTTCNNYGINMMVSVMCDVTDIIIKNRTQFASVIQKQTAYELLRSAELNPEVVVSRYQSNVSRQDVRYELDGSMATYKRGLGTELEKAYAALEVETQGMDRICLGCNNHGIRYRTA